MAKVTVEFPDDIMKKLAKLEARTDAVLEKKAHAQWLMWLLLVVFDVMLCGMMVAFGFAF